MIELVEKIRTFPPGKFKLPKLKTYRKGEIAGIVRVSDRCVGCDTCRTQCPTGAMKGEIGVRHEIDYDMCINCGQCLINCPFGAIEQMSFLDEVMKKLDEGWTVVAIVAPAVRVAIAEEFGKPPGTLTVARLHAALKKAGFKIYENNFAADQTIMEEGTELIGRVAYWELGLKEIEFEITDSYPITWRKKVKLDLREFEKKPLPQFTSCCPAWVRYAEVYYPEILPHISSCKSPQQMAGPTAKTYGALKVWNVNPEKVYTVGIMPCTAKIYEASRPEFKSAWKWLREKGIIPDTVPPFRDVDAVLTTRDLAELFRRKGINPLEFPENEKPENFEWYSGGGTIFGTSGGVMEAAMRFAWSVLSGREPPATSEAWNFVKVRGYTHPRVHASITIPLKSELRKETGIDEVTLNVCVVNGIGFRGMHLKPVIDEVLSGTSRYHFIEVMTCPGGCLNGGGQPVEPMGTSWIDPVLPLPL